MDDGNDKQPTATRTTTTHGHASKRPRKENHMSSSMQQGVGQQEERVRKLRKTQPKNNKSHPPSTAPSPPEGWTRCHVYLPRKRKSGLKDIGWVSLQT